MSMPPQPASSHHRVFSTSGKHDSGIDPFFALGSHAATFQFGGLRVRVSLGFRIRDQLVVHWQHCERTYLLRMATIGGEN